MEAPPCKEVAKRKRRKERGEEHNYLKQKAQRTGAQRKRRRMTMTPKALRDLLPHVGRIRRSLARLVSLKSISSKTEHQSMSS